MYKDDPVFIATQNLARKHKLELRIDGGELFLRAGTGPFDFIQLLSIKIKVPSMRFLALDLATRFIKEYAKAVPSDERPTTS